MTARSGRGGWLIGQHEPQTRCCRKDWPGPIVPGDV